MQQASPPDRSGHLYHWSGQHHQQPEQHHHRPARPASPPVRSGQLQHQPATPASPPARPATPASPPARPSSPPARPASPLARPARPESPPARPASQQVSQTCITTSLAGQTSIISTSQASQTRITTSQDSITKGQPDQHQAAQQHHHQPDLSITFSPAQHHHQHNITTNRARHNHQLSTAPGQPAEDKKPGDGDDRRHVRVTQATSWVKRGSQLVDTPGGGTQNQVTTRMTRVTRIGGNSQMYLPRKGRCYFAVRAGGSGQSIGWILAR